MARVAGEPILASDLEREIAERARRTPGRFDDPEARRAVLDEMIELRLEVAAARERGLHESPAFEREVERILVRRLREAELADRLVAVVVDDADVEAAYRADPTRFTAPARARGAIVEVAAPSAATPELRAAALARAEALLAEARALEPGHRGFGPIAARHSEDRRSRYKGGDIGWIDAGIERTARLDAAVLRALFAIDEPGGLAPIVETDDAFFLVMLLDREAEKLRPLAQVAPMLRAELLESRRHEAEASWRAELAQLVGVEVDTEVLANTAPSQSEPLVTADVSPPTPPGLPR